MFEVHVQNGLYSGKGFCIRRTLTDLKCKRLLHFRVREAELEGSIRQVLSGPLCSQIYA